MAFSSIYDGISPDVMTGANIDLSHCYLVSLALLDHVDATPTNTELNSTTQVSCSVQVYTFSQKKHEKRNNRLCDCHGHHQLWL